jgi:transcriptional regulator with XRE-family HTH domain
MMEYHQTLQNHTTNLFSGQGSMKKTRVGRPRGKTVATTNLLTRRVRRLVDVAHDGNVHEASKVSGLAYATLRDLYSGRSTNPSLRTMQKLSDTYGVFPGWFTDERQYEEVPTGGWASFVAGMDGETSPASLREVVIPFSAWPLPKVYERLRLLLEQMPVSPVRPIIGEITDEKEISRLVTEHLLAPFMDAERISGRKLIFEGAFPDRSLRTAREIWIMRLRRLGILWQEILWEVFPDASK